MGMMSNDTTMVHNEDGLEPCVSCPNSLHCFHLLKRSLQPLLTNFTFTSVNFTLIASHYASS